MTRGARRPVAEQWQPVPKPPAPPMCDLCDRPAVWQHREGGLRCARCPRPVTPA